MEINKYIDGLYAVDVKSNLDLKNLKKSCIEMKEIITQSFEHDENDYGGKSSDTTLLYRKYNLLMYPLPGIHNLHFNIASTFHRCFEDSNGQRADGSEEYFIQCWLNYYKNGEFIDWHTHSNVDNGAWHGFVCVDTEPDSFTSYRWPNNPNRKDIVIDIPSKDGFIVIGRSNGDYHRSSKWLNKKKPRITIAFDIIPRSFIFRGSKAKEYLSEMEKNPYFKNHWIAI